MNKQGQFTGEVISDYRVGEKLGQGGMGEAYQAFQLADNTLVAVKFLLSDTNDDESAELFKREADVHRELEHTNIIPFLGFEVQEIRGSKVPYIVMAYAPDGSLQDLIKKQRLLPLDRSVDILLQISKGLEYAHTHPRRVLHRDIKPANILLDKNRAMLADFGIYTGAHSLDSFIWQMDTFTGPIVAGTLPYMSLEQIKGNPRIPSDIYSLAVVAYQILTGRLPLNGKPLALLQVPIPGFNQTLVKMTPPLEAVEEVVVKALDRDPRRRHQSAGEFHNDLEEKYTKAKEKEDIHKKVLDMQNRAVQRLSEVDKALEKLLSHYNGDEFKVVASLSKECDSLIEQLPNNPLVYLVKGKVLIIFLKYSAGGETYMGIDSFQEYDEELALFDKAISLDPRNPKAYQEKGEYLGLISRNFDVIMIYPGDLFDKDSTYCKARELSNQGEYEEVLTLCDQELYGAKKVKNTSYALKTYLDLKADTLINLGRYDEAEKIYDMFIEQEPYNYIGYLGKAKVLEKTKGSKNAIA